MSCENCNRIGRENAELRVFASCFVALCDYLIYMGNAQFIEESEMSISQKYREAKSALERKSC